LRLTEPSAGRFGPVKETGRCDSCGRDDEVVVALRRVYLTLADWDTEEKVEVVAEVERWCEVCRDHYPHQLLGDGEGPLPASPA